VYGQEQVLAGSLLAGDYYVTHSKWLELRDFAVEAGDLLMTLVGVGTIGKVLTVEGVFEPGLINPRLMRIRPDRSKCLVNFLAYLIRSQSVRQQFNRYATGGTMPVLNGSVVRRVGVPIVPVDEQKRIADRLRSCESAIASERDSLSRLRQIRSGLMADLLSGRILVNAIAQSEVAGTANV